MKKIKLVTLALTATLVLFGCTPDQKEETAGSSSTAESTTVSSETEDSTDAESGATEQVVVPAGTYAMKQLYTAPHGDKSFAVTTLVMDEDKILAASMDEFQFLPSADFDGVPNSDASFGENYPKDLVLASKLANDEAYSGMMADKGGATKTYSESMKAITDYAVGKTGEELQKEMDANESMTDVITGATFGDASGYVESIVKTALYGHTVAGAKVIDGDIKLNQVYGAPHGDKSFAVTTVALVNDKIVAAYLDEFQFVGGMEAVPSSDGDFGKNFPADTPLIAKSDNDEAYSKMMKENGGATQNYSESLNEIIAYVIDKTAADIEKDLAANEEMTEVVTGATFSDTTGYVGAFAEAAK